MKLQASDLRIGNLVALNHLQNYVIKEILHDGVTFGNDRQTQFKYIKPIPLTEEWLVNFGFDYVRNINEYHNILINEGAYYLKPVGDSFDHWYLYHKEKMITTNIRYVHQLQNLYFALTLKELILKT